MRVMESTPDRMVVKMLGEGFLLVAIGLIFMVGSLVGTFFLVQTTELNCRRVESTQVNCSLERTIFGYTVHSQELYGLQRVQLAERTDSDGDLIYRVNLYTRDGVVPLTPYSSNNFRRNVNHAEEISRYLRGPEAKLNLVDRPGVFWLITGVLTIAGAATIITGVGALFSSWIFDRVNGQIVHDRRGLIGAKDRRYHLADVTGAFVRSKRDSDGATYRVELHTRKGETIPLTGYYTSGYRRKEKVANQIQRFLNS